MTDDAPSNAALFASVGQPPPDGSEPERARAYESVMDGRLLREDLGFTPTFPRLADAVAAGASRVCSVDAMRSIAQMSDRDAAQGELTGRHHLAFAAKDRATVDEFHRAAIAAGGRDNGKPGERTYHPGYYAAFVLDPDGNNIEVVYHGEATYSAPSIMITWNRY